MASKIQGITVEIGGDTTKLGNALKSVNSQSRSLQTELKGVNSLLKMDPANVTLLNQKQELLNKSIVECKEKLNILKTTQEQVQKQFEKGEITEEQFRDFQREIVNTEIKLKSLKDESKDFGSVFAQQVAVAGEKVQNAGQNIESAGKKMLGVTGAVTGLGTAAVAVGSDFDGAMKQVAATMGITVEEIENGSESYEILENAAKECGETTKFSASEAAEALNYLALAGYDAEKSAETLPKVLNLAAAGGLDLATASDMVTDAMAALEMETNELDKYIDEMAKTSQKSNTSVAQLGEATLTCAGTVKMSGMSLETMNTELGILANNGIKGAEGGTHLRNIILSLTSPTDTASDALKNLGISVLDSQGNVRDLNDIMTDFNSKLDGLSDGEKTEIISSIFNKTDISAVNALIKGSGEEFSNLKAQLSDCDGAAQDMADTMNSSFSGQLTLLKSQLEGIAIQISQILMPVLMKIVNKISELLTWFSGLNDSTKTVIVVIASLVAAIGPVLIMIGKVVGSVGTIMTYGPRIATTLKNIGKILTPLKTALKSLFAVIAANPITIVITAIVALIAVFVLLWNKCEWFRNFWIGLWERIKSACSSAINGIKQFFSNLIQTISEIIESIKSFFEGLYNQIVIILDQVKTALVEIYETIKMKIEEVLNFLATIAIWINNNVIQPILSVIIPIVTKIGEIIAKIWEIITVLFGVLCQWVYDNIINPILEAVLSFVNSVIEFAQSIWNAITAIFILICQWIQDNIITPIINLIQNFISAIVLFFTNLWNTVVEIFSVVAIWFSNKFTEAKDGIVNAIIPIIQWFANLWNDIKGIFSSVGNFFSEMFYNAYQAVIDKFGAIKDWFANLWNDIKNLFSDAGSSIANGIGDTFKNVLNSVITLVQNKINNFINSINKAIDTINNIPGVNISKINTLSLPQFKNGTDWVPYDNYLALLHKGERVLTAEENKEYSQSNATGNIINQNENTTNLNIEKFYNNREQDIQALAEELEFYKNKYAEARGG